MTALDMINRLDDGLPVSPAALALLGAAEAHASAIHYRRERQVDQCQNRCVICGGSDGPECAGCTTDWDYVVARSCDV